jgi:hypothetical protein
MAPHEVEVTEPAYSAIRQITHHRSVDSILRVQGREIVDGHGNPVILKGVSFENP